MYGFDMLLEYWHALRVLFSLWTNLPLLRLPLLQFSIGFAACQLGTDIIAAIKVTY